MIKLLNRTDACKLIGVSPNTFLKLVKQGLPFIVIGKSKFYRAVDIDEFLESKRVFSYSSDSVAQNDDA